MSNISNIQNLPEFKNLSIEEQKVALQIMDEYINKGESKKLNNLIYDDYEEIPVTIEEFVDNDYYLGQAWKDNEGKTKLYPYWRKRLNELFPDNITTNVNNAIFSGARGLGKSEIAVLVAAYLMYRDMCLKNPIEHYHLKPTEKLCYAFMNIKLALAEEIGNSKFQNTVKMSPWFLNHGTLEGRSNKMWVPPSFINIIIGSQASDVIGLPVKFAFFDEISFIQNQDIDKQKQKAKDMIDTAIGGMKTRFLFKGKLQSLLVLASSKRSEKSFLEEHMKKKLQSEGENVLIVDEPVWNIKPPETYSGIRFNVALGNKFLPSRVIEDNSQVEDYIRKGYTIIPTPIEFLSNFKEDIDRALCDYAGISSSELSKYISGKAVEAIIKKELINPFTKDIIEVGNDTEDKSQYYDYFDLNRVPSSMMSKPLFIHLDMSVSGDMTGIAGVWIKGKKISNDKLSQANDLSFQLAFSVSIKAPKGRQISFEKNRQFIYWLKEQGFKIKGITTDTFQSYDTGQALKAKGYNYEILSVDRVDPSSHICIPYQYFKSTIDEGRLEMYDSITLIEEIVNLERNINTGKVDHPTDGCFTGDTKVRLVDGTSKSFFELVDDYRNNKVNWVYSINKNTHKIEPKRIIKAWKTKENQPLVRITLDNGESVECTFNHRFMLRTGHYVEAQNLLPGDSLMPLYTKYPDKGLINYRMYYEPYEDKWHYEHRSFAKEILDEKYLVHHKDCNPKNNQPDNLIWCSRKAHKTIHDEIETGANSLSARKKRSVSVKHWHEKNKGSIKYKERADKTRQSVLAYNKQKYGHNETVDRQQHIELLEKHYNINWNNATEKERRHYAVKYNREVDVEYNEKINAGLKRAHAAGKFINANKALSNSNNHIAALKKLFPTMDRNEFKEYFGFEYGDLDPKDKAQWFNRYRKKKYDLLNHTVVNIEFLDRRADVYDIEVEDNHNFALDVGVFVHNSKDVSDAVCGAIFNASKHAEEFAYDYGEDLSITTTINNSTSFENNKQQINLLFEQEMQKAFDPRIRNQQPQDQTKKENNNQPQQTQFMDFGLGTAKPLNGAQYLKDGIIIW